MGQYVLTYAAGAVFLFIALLIFSRPIKWLLKLCLNSALGCAGLITFNFLGSLFGLHIGVNLVTCLTVGILGLPGFPLLLVLQFLTG